MAVFFSFFWPGVLLTHALRSTSRRDARQVFPLIITIQFKVYTQIAAGLHGFGANNSRRIIGGAEHSDTQGHYTLLPNVSNKPLTAFQFSHLCHNEIRERLVTRIQSFLIVQVG